MPHDKDLMHLRRSSAHRSRLRLPQHKFIWWHPIGACGGDTSVLLKTCDKLSGCAAMNEVTWQHVLAWEALHAGECADPQLLRFTGRPDELRYKTTVGCRV